MDELIIQIISAVYLLNCLEGTWPNAVTATVPEQTPWEAFSLTRGQTIGLIRIDKYEPQFITRLVFQKGGICESKKIHEFA